MYHQYILSTGPKLVFMPRILLYPFRHINKLSQSCCQQKDQHQQLLRCYPLQPGSSFKLKSQSIIFESGTLSSDKLFFDSIRYRYDMSRIRSAQAVAHGACLENICLFFGQIAHLKICQSRSHWSSCGKTQC